MLDTALRPVTQIVLVGVAARLPRLVSPTQLSVAGAFVGLSAAAAASQRYWGVALVAWLLNRFLDGLDGALARQRNTTSPRGAYLDLCIDFVVYAAVPLGVAAGLGTASGWAAAAVLVASFYVNAITWALPSQLTPLPNTPGSRQPGLIEGTETVLFFVVLLAWPDAAVATMYVMAVAVALSAAVHFVGNWRSLDTSERPRHMAGSVSHSGGEAVRSAP